MWQLSKIMHIIAQPENTWNQIIIILGDIFHTHHSRFNIILQGLQTDKNI